MVAGEAAVLTYVLQRLVLMVPTLIGVLCITFILVYLTPTDPARLIAGETAPVEAVQAIRRQLGLDLPLPMQFLRYAGSTLRGDLGVSIITGRPVLGEVMRHFGVTVQLVLAATLVAVATGIPLGVFAALKKGTLADRLVSAVGLTFYSFPSFWIGLILMWLVGFKLRWLPMLGSRDPLWTLDGIRHFALPAITLASIQIAPLARLTRSAMLEVLGQDYIRTARAKGLQERRVIFKHALRNASLPVITILGMELGYFLGGAVVIEEVFALPGLGRLMIGGVIRSDFPIVQGSILVFSVSFMLVGLLTDISYALLNPRITYR